MAMAIRTIASRCSNPNRMNVEDPRMVEMLCYNITESQLLLTPVLGKVIVGSAPRKDIC
jgi:hypothetical protein